MGIKGDLLLIQRAVNQEWDSDGLKPQALAVVESALESHDARVRIRAVEIILKMVEQNRKREQLTGIQSDRNRFLAIAERLGIGAAPERVAEGGSVNDPPTVDGTARLPQRRRGKEKG